MNKPTATIRWQISRAADEFDIDRKTLAKRLTGTVPGADGNYSTVQICAVVFGDYEFHRARKMAADADMTELKSRKQEGQLLEAEQVDEAWASIIIPAKQRLQTIPSKIQSRLSLTAAQTKCIEQEIDDALTELSKEPDYAADGPTQTGTPEEV